MKKIYTLKAGLFLLCALFAYNLKAQVPTTVTAGVCSGLVANYNTNNGGANSPSVYSGIFDSSFYYHAGRGYWTDYLPPTRTAAPGAPRVQTIISPPYANPNPNGTFEVGFYYIVPNPAVDRFQVRIISVTQTPMGTVSDVVATSGLQTFANWSTPTPYVDGTTPPVPADPTIFMVGSQGNICMKLIDADIVNGSNTTFRVEVTYIITSPLFVVFDNLSVGPLNSPLPVNFIGLVANRNGDNVSLKWDVSGETDVNRYQVEKSENGVNFTIEGSVLAGGKPIYSFTSSADETKTVFFRIRSIDHDGQYKYSGIVKLAGNAGSSYADKISVYPVPAQNELTIRHPRLDVKSKFMVISSEGKILKTIYPVTGASHTPVNLEGLTPGLYIIKVDDGSSLGQTIKFIKN